MLSSGRVAMSVPLAYKDTRFWSNLPIRLHCWAKKAARLIKHADTA